MATFETGAALQVDAGRCECAGPGDPFGPISQLAVSVPHQTSFPARFFAQVGTTASDKPWIAFLVFTRADPRSPWLLQLIGGYAVDAVELGQPHLDAAGYLLPQSMAPLTDPSTVHASLASYWREAKRTGKVPPSALFDPGEWTDEYAKQLTEHHQGAVTDNGLVGYYAYATNVAQEASYAFPEGQGWQIVCAAIHIQKTFVGSKPGRGPYQDLSLHHWGKGVPPGVHQSVTVNEISVPCIEVPAAGTSQKARVYGGQEYTDVTTYT